MLSAAALPMRKAVALVRPSRLRIDVMPLAVACLRISAKFLTALLVVGFPASVVDRHA